MEVKIFDISFFQKKVIIEYKKFKKGVVLLCEFCSKEIDENAVEVKYSCRDIQAKYSLCSSCYALKVNELKELEKSFIKPLSYFSWHKDSKLILKY